MEHREKKAKKNILDLEQAIMSCWTMSVLNVQ